MLCKEETERIKTRENKKNKKIQGVCELWRITNTFSFTLTQYLQSRLTGVPARTPLWPLSFAIKVETEGKMKRIRFVFCFFVFLCYFIINFPFVFVRERLAAPVGRVGGII
jgi:hypothetical protein